MARAIWSGFISFGLVNIPVRLHTAARSHAIHFHLIDPEENVRVRQQYVRPGDGEEVPYGELVKGYEVSPDRYVIVQPGELASIQPETTRTLDIEDFVDLADIDPVFYERPYYLTPDEGGAKAYRLLVAALHETEKVGIAKFVMRNNAYLAAIRARDGALVLETMRFADEVVPLEDLDGLPGDDVEVSDRELRVAKQLIDSLAADFEPSAYTDQYRQAVLALIEKKAEGEEIVVGPPAEEEPGKVIDLMAALEKSLEQARQSGGKARGKAGKKSA